MVTGRDGVDVCRAAGRLTMLPRLLCVLFGGAHSSADTHEEFGCDWSPRTGVLGWTRRFLRDRPGHRVTDTFLWSRHCHGVYLTIQRAKVGPDCCFLFVQSCSEVSLPQYDCWFLRDVCAISVSTGASGDTGRASFFFKEM